MTWQIELGIGLFFGIYVSSVKVRHVANTLITISLKSILWLFQKMEATFGKGKVEEGIEVVEIRQVLGLAVSDNGKPKVQVSDDDIKRWLADNPDLTVSQRR